MLDLNRLYRGMEQIKVNEGVEMEAKKAAQLERKKERANRKVEKAIDTMIDIKDMGLGNDTVQRILDALNGLHF